MDSTLPTAIPAYYGDTRTDSRLEARWARFIDEHGITWEYHPETYRVGGEHYEPDFWLPDIRTILEVKGAFSGPRDFKVLTFARHASEHDVLSIVGQGPAGESFMIVHPTPQEVAYPGTGRAQSLLDRAVFFGRCTECGAYQFVESAMAWDCRFCGHYDGASTYADVTHPSAPR